MPVYPYKCPKCGGEVEFTMSLKDYENSVIPKCMEPGCDGQIDLQRVYTPLGLKFNGGGWTPKFYGEKD